MDDAAADTVRCDVCGKTVECRTDDVLRLGRSAWPVCCGEPMDLQLPDPPTAESDGELPVVTTNNPPEGGFHIGDIGGHLPVSFIFPARWVGVERRRRQFASPSGVGSPGRSNQGR